MAKKTAKQEAKAESQGPGETSSKYRNLSLRGQSFVGVVVSAKPIKSATVEFTRRYFVPKYERFEKRKIKLHVHNPPSIDAKEGDIVRVMETRPLSKTIHHTIVEKIGEERAYKGRKMIEDEEKAKISSKKKQAEALEEGAHSRAKEAKGEN